MNLQRATNPSAEELRAWAYDASLNEPIPDWDLVLSSQMDRGLLRSAAEFAADPRCPHAAFFLLLLFQWVHTVVKDEKYEMLRTLHEEWLDVVTGIRNKQVKEWRHQARLLFQNQKVFERVSWWKLWAQLDEDLRQSKLD